MEFTTDNAHTTRATRSDLATALRNPERVLHAATVDVGAKTPSFETALPVPAGKPNNGMAPSFTECVMAAHTVTKTNEDMACTLVKSDSDSTDYNPQPPSKSIVKPSYDMRSEIESALADFIVVTKTDVEPIVKNDVTKWTTTLQSQIVKAVESLFKNTMQTSYFNSNNGLKSALFNVFEQALGQVVRSGHTLTESEA